MNKGIAILIAAAGLGLSVLPASAQASRTWVSGSGNDAFPCNRTAPCLTFAGALSKTAAGGEIDCIDAGGFGAVTITKSITIDCGGVAGGPLASSGFSGITVNAGVNDRVVLRNLSVQGAGTGGWGIRFFAGLHLTVENVRITGLSFIGIDVNKTADGHVYIRNTNIANVQKGIKLLTSAGAITAQIDNTRIDGASVNGLEVMSASTVVSISNSVIMNSGTGMITTGSGFINAEKNIIAKNTTGVLAGVNGSSIRISNNAFADNGTAVSFFFGGTVSTAGNNTVVGPPGSAPNGGAIPAL